jgi:hypothetical protein
MKLMLAPRAAKLLAAASLLLLQTSPAEAKDSVDFEEKTAEEEAYGPRINPFECYGRYESASGNRTVKQIGIELKKKFDQLNDNDPRTVKAMKACVIARLKARLGHSDARKWFKRSIELDPEEPGYELFMGMYYSMQRGARAPVLEEAELHLSRAMVKLETLEKEGKFKSHHEIVRDFAEKRLMVLYQQDGQQLFPFKGPKPNGKLLDVPAVSVFGEALVSGDTRDFWYNNEMRVFTGEKQFAQSGTRANRALTPRETYDLARAPLRLNMGAGLRLRQNKIGTFDAAYGVEQAPESQITSFYNPTLEFSDVRVDQLRLGYQRVFPLYPLFDLRIAADYLHTRRTGVLEFEPTREEKFHGFNIRPSISRFLGPNKITLDGVVAYLDITDLPGGVPDQGMRSKLIRGAKLTYSHYAPLTGLSFHNWHLLPYRQATRGFSVFGGILEDYETYGIRQVKKADLYGGIEYGAPKHWAINAQGTYLTSSTTFIDQNDPNLPEYTDGSQNFRGVRASTAITGIIIDQEARPLMSDSPFEVDMLNVVVPLQWDKTLEGYRDFENVRGGLALWAKFFGPKTAGTPLLFSAGYDMQYFYNINKISHLWRAGLRLGWGDHL